MIFSVLVAILPHPEEVQSSFFRGVLLLGRLSILRHGSAPGTLHFPGTKQPWWIGDRRASGARAAIGRIPIAPAAVLLLLFFGACTTPLARGRLVAAQALKSQGALADELRAFSAREEAQILATAPRTQEEVQARLGPFRRAVDLALKLLERSGQALQDVAAALDARPSGGTP